MPVAATSRPNRASTTAFLVRRTRHRPREPTTAAKGPGAAVMVLLRGVRAPQRHDKGWRLDAVARHSTGRGDPDPMPSVTACPRRRGGGFVAPSCRNFWHFRRRCGILESGAASGSPDGREEATAVRVALPRSRSGRLAQAGQPCSFGPGVPVGGRRQWPSGSTTARSVYRPKSDGRTA
jgi:hypothetical protein